MHVTRSSQPQQSDKQSTSDIKDTLISIKPTLFKNKEQSTKTCSALFKQQKETSIDKNQSHTTKMDKGNIKKIDDTIPEPSFDNHDKALKWANKRLGSYAEIRSVALILKTFPQNNLNDLTEPDKDTSWSINIKEGRIRPDAKNVMEFMNEIKKLIQGDATLTKAEPTIIWLPNAIKHIWAINLVQPNKE